MLATLFVLSVIMVAISGALAIAVSPVFFLALMASLAVPALLTLFCYKSPNRHQAILTEEIPPPETYLN
jgi:hypothetical protein